MKHFKRNVEGMEKNKLIDWKEKEIGPYHFDGKNIVKNPNISFDLLLAAFFVPISCACRNELRCSRQEHAHIHIIG